jgi:hypothetical protein
LVDPGPGEEQGRREFVVCSQERERFVQYLHSLPLKPWQLPKTGLDPIERRQHVEAREREIAVSKVWRPARFREPRPLPLFGEGLDQSTIRLRRLAEDHDRAGPISTLRRSRPDARAPLARELDVCNCHPASSAAATKLGLRAG